MMLLTALRSTALACAGFFVTSVMSSKDGPPQGANPDTWPTGYIPFRPPSACYTTHVYCLHVQSPKGVPEEWLQYEGHVSWIEEDKGKPWRTYGKADLPPALATC